MNRGSVVALTDRLLNDVDDDRVDLIVRYLPVRIGPAELKTGAAILGKYGWPLPAPGQVVLVALNGDRETIATTTIAADPAAAATRLGEGFLKQHLPPTRDARAMLTAARDEARKTGRRVWFIESGPRCAPCFRLGRWIDDHHAALEKDFVILKVMDGLDAHAAEVVKELPISDGDGIPWHAITEPDGTILVTSHGSLGNIGFPSSVEGIRHFRQMLERTAAEADGRRGRRSHQVALAETVTGAAFDARASLTSASAIRTPHSSIDLFAACQRRRSSARLSPLSLWERPPSRFRISSAAARASAMLTCFEADTRI